jgi:hypothetical protein
MRVRDAKTGECALSETLRMEAARRRSNPPLTHGLNIIPFAGMAGGWLAPLLMFWLYVWGPLRPFSYPAGDLMPGVPFAFLIIGCIALWWLLPAGYFTVRRFEQTGRIYESLGVRLFRQCAPDGDLANRWERRADPRYRVIRGRRCAERFVERTERSERGHLVLLMLGIVSAVYAWNIGWHGWAVYMSAGNVLVNVYPMLLQRYTRSRLYAVLRRGAPTSRS